jgi:hypothetical protein
MEIFYKTALLIHVVSGFTALGAGMVAMLVKKGQRVHRLSGLVFFYAMLGVAASAISISVSKSNLFLLHIGIFALYQNVSGYRATRNKTIKPNWLDWSMWGIAAINSFFMLYHQTLVLMVFGTISSILVIGDLRIFIRHIQGQEIPKLEWLSQHIGMMMGTYIATSTAFVVVNANSFRPAWLPWLLPTALGVPLIVYFTRKYAPRNKRKTESVN